MASPMPPTHYHNHIMASPIPPTHNRNHIMASPIPPTQGSYKILYTRKKPDDNLMTFDNPLTTRCHFFIPAPEARMTG